MSGRYRGLLIALALAGACSAQQPDASVNGALASLTQRAGVIFAGEVTAIRRNLNVVEVDFRVEQSLKGAAGSYRLREWGGLWAAAQRRYWVGERAVFFLHAASGSGLSTPVDGMDGVLPLVAEGVDVRRVRTRVQREVGQPMPEGPESVPLETVSSVVAAQLPAVTLPVKPVRPRPILPAMPIASTDAKNPVMVRQFDAPQ